MAKIRTFVFNPFQLNTYLISDDTGECVIIDAGNYIPEEDDVLRNYIDSNNLKPVLFLNTHCHVDHILGNGFVTKEYKLKPIYHQEEEYNLTNAQISARMYGLPIPEIVPPEKYVEEGEKLSFGDTVLEVLHTPGHSLGHVTYLIKDQKMAIVGDVLFSQSIGRTDLPGGNYEQLIQSIRTKLLVLDDNYEVYPGHGPKTTIGAEKMNNPFLV